MHRGRIARVLALGFCGIASLAGAPACTATANVSDLYLSPDEDGTRRRTTFFTDSKKVHCVAELGVGRPDVTLKIFFRQVQKRKPEDNSVEDTDIVVGFLEFKPDRSDSKVKEVAFIEPNQGAPLPAGRFICEAVLDGELAKSATFNIDFPDCPTAEIIPTSRCLGFYDLGRSCKKAGLSGTNREGTCVCELGGWKCDR